MSYKDKVLTISPANLIGYWPLDELSGTNADNAEGTSARDGTYTGVTLNSTPGPDGTPAGLWDGVNDDCDIFSNSFRDAFNDVEGTFLIWCKVLNAGVWTDGQQRRPFEIRFDISNRIVGMKNADNQYTLRHSGSGNNRSGDKSSISTTDWFHLGMTWSIVNDETEFYFDGIQFESLAAPVAWADVFATATLGKGNYFAGYLAHAAIWTTPLSQPEITQLADPATAYINISPDADYIQIV